MLKGRLSDGREWLLTKGKALYCQQQDSLKQVQLHDVLAIWRYYLNFRTFGVILFGFFFGVFFGFFLFFF